MHKLTICIDTPEGIAPDELGRVLGDLATRLPSVPTGQPIPLQPEHFMQLRAVRGSRAKRLPALPLVRTAFRLAGRELSADMEAWLKGEVRMTIRAAVKRSGVRSRKER